MLSTVASAVSGSIPLNREAGPAEPGYTLHLQTV